MLSLYAKARPALSCPEGWRTSVEQTESPGQADAMFKGAVYNWSDGISESYPISGHTCCRLSSIDMHTSAPLHLMIHESIPNEALLTCGVQSTITHVHLCLPACLCFSVLQFVSHALITQTPPACKPCRKRWARYPIWHGRSNSFLKIK